MRGWKWLGTGLLCSASLCLAQTSGDTEKQIAEHNRRIQEYLQEKRPDLALPELRALVALDQNNADAHGNLGVLLYFRDDCAAAIPELRAATGLQSGLWRLQFLLGTCERRSGDTEKARADLESVFPHLDDAKMRLEAGMLLADIEVNAGDLNKAASVVSTLRVENATNVAVLYMEYRIHSELASEAMLSLSMVDPNSAQAHEIMAHESMRYGDPASAIAQYRAALKTNPNLPEAHFELAEVLSESLSPNDRKEAEVEYRSAFKLNPGDAKSECRLGDIEFDKGNLQQAYDDYAGSLKLAPADIDAKLGMARTLIQLDRQSEALPLLKQVLETEPENYEAHYILSRAYWQQGRKDDARQELDLYKRYKAIHDKLHEMYKTMRLTPSEIRAQQTTGQDDLKEK
jgi:tetratricopeptide (TPR) repeat protein